MPWEIKGKCVHKKGGAVVKCHDTVAKAQAHMRALYANTEGGTKSFDDWYVYQHQLTQAEAGYDPLGMAKEQACANCQFFHTPDGCLVVAGDISPTGKSRFWTEKVKYEPEPLPVYIVDVSEGVKSTTESSIQEKVMGWLGNIMGKKDETSSSLPVGLRPIYLTDEEDGTKRAWMFGSNNFEDRHGHYIREDTQQEYIDWANKHPDLMPEYYIWHMGEKTKWGKADTVARFNNFTLWSGPVDKGFEPFAEAVAADPNTSVSNGYFAALNEDNTEFELWRPYELSVLPLAESANVWMGDEEALKLEGYMPMDEGTKALLKQRGASDEFLNELDKYTSARAQAVTANGVGQKSIEEPPPNPGPTDPPPENPPPAPGGNATATGSITIEQITGALAQVIAPINAKIAALEEGQKSFEGRLGKTQEDLVAEQLTAQISQAAAQGFKASEDPNNIVSDQGKKDDNWLVDELDRLMQAGGLAANGSVR